MDCKLTPEPAKLGALLAKIISGFANAEGGVCLWGIDARKKNELDCVVALPGVQDPLRLASRLDELTAQCVSPGVQGVTHRSLVRPDGIGFVATYVPSSDLGPHMARAGEDRYYQRIGQSFLRMEHFQIADMFGRRARPSLSLEPIAQGTEVRLRISNMGRGSAQAPFVRLKVNGPFHRNQYGVDGNYNEHLPYKYTDRDGSWVHATGADVVIHPGTSLLLGGAWLGHSYQGDMPHACTVEYELGAMGMELRKGRLVVPINNA